MLHSVYLPVSEIQMMQEAVCQIVPTSSSSHHGTGCLVEFFDEIDIRKKVNKGTRLILTTHKILPDLKSGRAHFSFGVENSRPFDIDLIEPFITDEKLDIT